MPGKSRLGVEWQGKDLETTLGWTRRGTARRCAARRGTTWQGFQNKPNHRSTASGTLAVTRPLRMIRRWFFWRGKQMARSIHTRRKLGEHVQVMHEGAWFLGVVRQLWPPARGEQWQYTIELDGGEEIIANAGDIQRQKHNFTSDPTPDEIRERAAEIRAEWPPEVASSRWQGAKAEPVQIQRIGRTSAAGRMESDE